MPLPSMSVSARSVQPDCVVLMRVMTLTTCGCCAANLRIFSLVASSLSAAHSPGTALPLLLPAAASAAKPDPPDPSGRVGTGTFIAPGADPLAMVGTVDGGADTTVAGIGVSGATGAAPGPGAE